MAKASLIRVVTSDGVQGTIEDDLSTATQVELKLSDGRKMLVPTDALIKQADGSYTLAIVANQPSGGQLDAAAVIAHRDEIVIPLAQEVIEIEKRMRETGRVRIDKVVHELDQVVDEPLLREQVEVEHVAINQHIDQPAQSRYEGDTLVLPIMEEVLVVEKRLMLKEEVRITVRKTTVNEPQHVTVRQEEVTVQRLPPQQP